MARNIAPAAGGTFELLVLTALNTGLVLAIAGSETGRAQHGRTDTLALCAGARTAGTTRVGGCIGVALVDGRSLGGCHPNQRYQK